MWGQRIEREDRQGDRMGHSPYTADTKNTLPQKNLTPSHQEKIEEGWEAISGIYL